ncbi:MAG: TIGR03621 family F420-dependent LLM class oxidoreductase [Actinomycetia bacterium]|nr:TIGR03621 family F420-dependent LLM class oxidoreductase [Actinomycetes bacterium]
MASPFRFAVQMDGPLEGRSWVDSCREMEDLGYDTIMVPDHFDEGLGPISAMAAAAAVTSTIKVAPLVLDCDFRHPAPLARELATIDAMSEGRLEVGVGAGWKRTDYVRSGISMDRPGVRVSRMIEHATILRQLFTSESVSFEGEHYSITDLPGEPATHAPGGPPFLVGGGAPRVLRFAGGFADIVGINPSIHSGEIDTSAAQDGLPDRIDEKVGWVGEGASARADGKSAEDLEINAWLAAAEITEDRAGVGEMLGAMFGVEPAVGLEAPVVLVGTESQVTEDLHARRDRWGYSYTVIPGDKAREFAPVVGGLTGS